MLVDASSKDTLLFFCDINSAFKSFVEGFINDLLRTVQILNRLAVDPVLQLPEIIVFWGFSLLALQPGGVVRKQGGVESSYKDPIDNMAEKHLQLEGSPLDSVVRVPSMNFLVNPPHSVSVAHLELGKVLIFAAKPVL